MQYKFAYMCDCTIKQYIFVINQRDRRFANYYRYIITIGIVVGIHISVIGISIVLQHSYGYKTIA